MLKKILLIVGPAILLINGCSDINRPSEEVINELAIKRGQLISCGPDGKQFGNAEFPVSCNNNIRDDFNLAIKLLHSFEYDEAEKAFALVIDQQPDCAMAYWGIAMSNFHPLWTPPSEYELKKGSKAIELANSLNPTKKEKAYINALSLFFSGWETTDHKTRALNFEKGMEKIYTDYPDDHEGQIFYALALCAASDPNDKKFIKQKKAGQILKGLYPGQPDHPGIVHYLIHAYDYPELAKEGLNAARKYATIAPSSAHALHMPSHIFTRLGLWDECIQSNIASVVSAQCYATEAGIKGHWDEELHGLDYLVYAYLQKGATDSAKKYWDYLQTIKDVSPVNFKVAYTFSAVPSRYLIENRMWKEAAVLEPSPLNFQWKDYPWQKAIVHFTRLLGAIHINQLDAAKKELQQLNALHISLVNMKDSYKANQVAIQIQASEAWISMKEGKKSEAIRLMQIAADMEDKTEKHPVTPGEVIPAMEQLADLYLEANQPAKALETYEQDLSKRPNRFNTLYGAAYAAKISGDNIKAKSYYNQLINIAGKNSGRKELEEAKIFLELHPG